MESVVESAVELAASCFVIVKIDVGIKDRIAFNFRQSIEPLFVVGCQDQSLILVEFNGSFNTFIYDKCFDILIDRDRIIAQSLKFDAICSGNQIVDRDGSFRNDELCSIFAQMIVFLFILKACLIDDLIADRRIVAAIRITVFIDREEPDRSALFVLA